MSVSFSASTAIPLDDSQETAEHTTGHHRTHSHPIEPFAHHTMNPFFRLEGTWKGRGEIFFPEGDERCGTFFGTSPAPPKSDGKGGLFDTLGKSTNAVRKAFEDTTTFSAIPGKPLLLAYSQRTRVLTISRNAETGEETVEVGGPMHAEDGFLKAMPVDEIERDLDHTRHVELNVSQPSGVSSVEHGILKLVVFKKESEGSASASPAPATAAGSGTRETDVVFSIETSASEGDFVRTNSAKKPFVTGFRRRLNVHWTKGTSVEHDRHTRQPELQWDFWMQSERHTEEFHHLSAKLEHFVEKK
jgi:THAP4-like, heme-binding beta-barrel domain